MRDGFQYQIDYRTGVSTAITGDTSTDAVRSACSALNLARAGGLLEAAQRAASGGPVPPDVWTDQFFRVAEELEVPAIKLEKLGIFRDGDGFSASPDLLPLPAGAEAQPYLDEDARVVYKLFDLRPNGSLGKKLVFERGIEDDALFGRFEVDVADAVWTDVIWKIAVLNSGGGLPGEIVGLADTGDFLISKQPQAYPISDFHADREAAEFAMRGIYPLGGGLRQRVFVTCVDDRFWLVGDLHERNIMRDSRSQPVIIDALLGEITAEVRSRFQWIDQACKEATSFRDTGTRPKRSFDDAPDEAL